MEQTLKQQVNISAPNLLNICIDQVCDGEMKGRFYHCYAHEPETFSNVIEMIQKAEDLFERLSFPQASTRARSFVNQETVSVAKRPEKCMNQEDLFEYKGALGTFITFVKFRQKSTWQGETFWVEGETKNHFLNVLDFIKMMDKSIGKQH